MQTIKTKNLQNLQRKNKGIRKVMTLKVSSSTTTAWCPKTSKRACQAEARPGMDRNHLSRRGLRISNRGQGRKTRTRIRKSLKRLRVKMSKATVSFYSKDKTINSRELKDNQPMSEGTKSLMRRYSRSCARTRCMPMNSISR